MHKGVAHVLGVALLASVLTMSLFGFGVQMLDGEWSLKTEATVVVLGCAAFLAAALLCCLPVFPILAAAGRVPRVSRSVALGACLTVPPACAVVALFFRDGEAWLATLLSSGN